ncbi:transposase [Streptomyces chryseus]
MTISARVMPTSLSYAEAEATGRIGSGSGLIRSSASYVVEQSAFRSSSAIRAAPEVEVTGRCPASISARLPQPRRASRSELVGDPGNQADLLTGLLTHLNHKPHGPLPQLGGVPPRCWHDSNPSKDQSLQRTQGGSLLTHRGTADLARFTERQCRPCPARTHCTTTADSTRTVGSPARELRDLQLRVRAEQQTPGWKARYAVRSGVEGTNNKFAHGHGMPVPLPRTAESPPATRTHNGLRSKPTVRATHDLQRAYGDVSSAPAGPSRAGPFRPPHYGSGSGEQAAPWPGGRRRW